MPQFESTPVEQERRDRHGVRLGRSRQHDVRRHGPSGEEEHHGPSSHLPELRADHPQQEGHAAGTEPSQEDQRPVDGSDLHGDVPPDASRWTGSPPHGLQRITFDEIRSPHAGRELGSLDGYVDKIGTEVNHGGFKWVVKKCGEPLFNYTSRPYRWAPALVIQRKCRRLFDYLIIDEVHEQKSDESAGKIYGMRQTHRVRWHVIALTGTLIGGYANHIFPL